MVMLVGGGILTACGVEPIGPMLIGAGVDAIIQRATTGHTSYGQVVLSGMLGFVGASSTLAGTALRKAVTTAAVSGGVSGAGTGAYTYMNNPGPHTAGGLLTATLKGGVTGTFMGGVSGAAGTVSTVLVRPSLAACGRRHGAKVLSICGMISWNQTRSGAGPVGGVLDQAVWWADQ